MALGIEDVHVSYGSSRVLHGINLEVPTGTVTALVGRNGVGKTTLLHAIMGLVPVTQGRIVAETTDLTRFAIYDRQRFGLALVPQGRRLFRSLTVDEHLSLVPAKPQGWFTRQSLFDLFVSFRPARVKRDF